MVVSRLFLHWNSAGVFYCTDYIMLLEEIESVEYQQDMAERRSQDPQRYEDAENRAYLDDQDREWKEARGDDDRVKAFFDRLDGDGTYLMMSRTDGVFRITRGDPFGRELCGYDEYGMHHYFKANRKLVSKLIDRYDFSPHSGLVMMSPDDIRELKDLGIEKFIGKREDAERKKEEFQAIRYQPKNDHPTNIYMMLDGHTGFIKIGRSKNPSTRERTLQAQVPLLEMIWVCSGMNSDETHLHKIFDKKRLRGEWFDLSGDDVDYIKSLKWRR